MLGDFDKNAQPFIFLRGQLLFQDNHGAFILTSTARRVRATLSSTPLM